MKNNKSALDFFDRLSRRSVDPKTALKLGSGDNSARDAIFLEPYLSRETHLLDIGSGSGLILNRIYQKVHSIIAIEPLDVYSKFIVSSPNIRIINEDALTFTSDEQFDLITCFGIAQYFNIDEIKQLYGKLYYYCKNHGKIVIKNQFGVSESVLIDGYSEKLQDYYFSYYRTVQEEIALLKDVGFSNFDVADVYPPEENHWSNTHFYAIVADKWQ